MARIVTVHVRAARARSNRGNLSPESYRCRERKKSSRYEPSALPRQGRASDYRRYLGRSSPSSMRLPQGHACTASNKVGHPFDPHKNHFRLALCDQFPCCTHALSCSRPSKSRSSHHGKCLSPGRRARTTPQEQGAKIPPLGEDEGASNKPAAFKIGPAPNLLLKVPVHDQACRWPTSCAGCETSPADSAGQVSFPHGRGAQSARASRRMPASICRSVKPE
jgi:hypothetical protein